MLFESIESRCKERGVSIAALEKAVGLGNATIKGWKTSSPRVDTAQKVADYFGCTIDELLAQSEDNKKEVNE